MILEEVEGDSSTGEFKIWFKCTIWILKIHEDEDAQGKDLPMCAGSWILLHKMLCEVLDSI